MELQNELDMTFNYEPIPYGSFKTQEEKIANGKMAQAIRQRRPGEKVEDATFSVAAISTHRRKNKETGSLEPISDYAKFCDDVDKNVLKLIHELKPRFWFIENPRGGMRKMEWMQGLPRYTVTYCQYGERRMKPTDIWTNHPNPQFKPPCKNGDSCHEAAPRGAKTGTQGFQDFKIMCAM